VSEVVSVESADRLPRLTVPTIDVGGLPDATLAIHEIALAAEEWGFFQIVNHGIAPELSDRFLAQVRLFFAFDTPSKHRVLRSQDNPMGFYDNELTKNTRDWKEVFDYGADLRDPAAAASRWPADLPLFRRTMIAWYDACETVSFTLLAAISAALDLPATTLASCFGPVHTSFVRLNYYPLCPDPAPALSGSKITHGALGVNRHTDAGALTVLIQDDVAALQVNRDDRWYTIQPEPGGLIINLGDMLQVWSNDRFKAAEHRVLAHSSMERYSAPFFFNPAFVTTCQPLNVADAEAKYHPINWGHYRTERHYGDFVDRGEEIQIAHFRRNN
jgi:isopenicillin N synthase-like dioxygenase